MAAKRAQQQKEPSRPPLAAERLIGFLNSRPHSTEPDGLARLQPAVALLESLGLDGGSLDAVGLERLRRLRDLLAVLADHDADASTRSQARDAVNAIAVGVPTAVRFLSDEESEVRPMGEGVDAIVGALIADLHRAVTSGSWRRVRLCAFEPCSEAFYDATRSRTQRWHSYEVCGNRANVAAYRRRAAASGTSSSR
ncbi:MAG: CGNR zinc finger domain-containing protein [Solirubrobacteraceae bacterium]